MHRSSPKIQIAHDFLVQMGGAERFVSSVISIFDVKKVYTSMTQSNSLLLPFKSVQVTNTFLQFVPLKSLLFRFLFFLYPFAFMTLRVDPDVDVLFISCSSFSKFIRSSPNTRRILYLHNVPRLYYDKDYVYNLLPLKFLSPIVYFLIHL